MANPGAPTDAPNHVLEELFLARLARLVALDSLSSLTATERTLVRQAIFRTYLDCRAAGARTQAEALLALRPGAVRPPTQEDT